MKITDINKMVLFVLVIGRRRTRRTATAITTTTNSN
jgi:hypothetical protein